ncbi:MAG: hypothetical protein HY906_16360 [Deltaproteobacteria bacterium]|nr:hypothetical protein [Deltaproteobacteria bacterium]
MTLDGKSPVTEGLKKARYALSFLRRGLVHTNLQLLYQCNFRCQICDFWRPEFQGAPRLSLADYWGMTRAMALTPRA